MSGYTFSEPSELKTIILYIIANYGEPVDNGPVTDIFMTHGFVDYFTLQIYLDELVEAGLLETYRDERNIKYLLTEIGQEALNGFATGIPKTVREAILKTIKQYRKKLDDGLIVTGYYKKHNELEHMAELSINEGGAPLLFISLNAGSKETASIVCQNFKRNPEAVYKKIIALLTSEN